MNDPFVQRMMGKVAQHRAKLRQLAAEVEIDDKENHCKVSSETRLRLNRINSLYEEDSVVPFQSTDNERNMVKNNSASKVGGSPIKSDTSSSSLNKAPTDKDSSEVTGSSVRKNKLNALAKRTKQLQEWEDDYTYHSTSHGSQVVVGLGGTLHDSVALHSANKEDRERQPMEKDCTPCSKFKTDVYPCPDRFSSEATKDSSSPSRFYFGGGLNPDSLEGSNLSESSVDSLLSASHSNSSCFQSSSVPPSYKATHSKPHSSASGTPITACKPPLSVSLSSASQSSLAQAFATACKPSLPRACTSQPSLPHTPTQVTPTKKLAWDHRMLNSLEAQGFTPTDSHSRLIYDFKKEQAAQEVQMSDSRPPSPGKNVTTSYTTSSSGEMSRSLRVGASVPGVSTATAANSRANGSPKIVSYHPKSPARSPERCLSQAPSQKHRSRDLSPSKVNDLRNQWEQHIREASPERKPVRQASPTRAVVRPASPAKAASPVRKPDANKSPVKEAGTTSVQRLSRRDMNISRPSPATDVVKCEAVMPPSIPLVNEEHMSSVKARAAAFDMAGGVRTSPKKDPAELSLKERLGLFEKQKDAALVPKAPFGQPVPAKALVDDRSDKSYCKNNTSATNHPVKNTQKVVPAPPPPPPPATATSSIAQRVEAFDKGMRSPSPTRCGPNTIHTHRRLFEQMQEDSWKENEINSKVQSERQKEMEVLLNRFKKPANKIQAQAPQPQVMVESETEYPESDEDSVLESSSCDDDLNAALPPGPPKPPRLYLDMPGSSTNPAAPPLPKSFLPNRNKVVAMRLNSTEISEAMQSPGKEYVPRIKPGFMYPALSDVESHSEAPESQESDFDDERESSFAESVLTCASLNSLGTRIQKSAIGQNSYPLAPVAEHDNTSSKLTMSESTMDALGAIDDAIDEALNDNEGSADGPTPPKRGRSSEDQTPSSSIYKTPKLTAETPSNSIFKTPKLTVENTGGELSPDSSLIHSISMYRKQKPEQITYTPVRQVVRQDADSPAEGLDSPSVVITARIKELQDEVCAQQSVISQASGAISVVNLRPELKGSTQHLEAERLLLISCQKRQAALNEIQRLKTEGALGQRNWASGTDPDSCHGSLSLSNIALPLKQDFIRKGTGTLCPHHLLLLVKHRDQVISSELLTTPKCIVEGCITFPNLIVLHNLASNFSIALEVYCLKMGADCNTSVKKEHSRLKLTPLKRLHKSESRTPSSPMISSPGGPNAVRTPAFQMVGFTHLNISTITRNAWTLEQVPFSSPLSGHLLMNVSCNMEGGITEQGFLTMFEDVGGYGAWNRRWCALQGTHLCYWMYPDDEKKKEPNGSIDLRSCTTRRVELVPRDVCARQHTFQLTCVRPATKVDNTNLVQEVRGSTVVSKLLLSADCKEERLLWCSQLNKALANIRAWDPDALRPEDYQV